MKSDINKTEIRAHCTKLLHNLIENACDTGKNRMSPQKSNSNCTEGNRMSQFPASRISQKDPMTQSQSHIEKDEEKKQNLF